MGKINASIIDTVRQFLAKLHEEGIDTESAYLFGSWARGAENKWSDIDVAIVSSNLSEDRFEERLRMAKVSATIDSRIEPVPFRPEAFIDEDPLVWEIKTKGILVLT